MYMHKYYSLYHSTIHLSLCLICHCWEKHPLLSVSTSAKSHRSFHCLTDINHHHQNFARGKHRCHVEKKIQSCFTIANRPHIFQLLELRVEQHWSVEWLKFNNGQWCSKGSWGHRGTWPFTTEIWAHICSCHNLSPFFLCRCFWYQLVAYCVCFQVICEMSL